MEKVHKADAAAAPTITSLGDSALLITVRESFADKPGETLDAVLAAQRRVENARLPGVIETAVGFTTVAVFFDPVRIFTAGVPSERAYQWLVDRVREAVSNPKVRKRGAETRLVEIPVCYDREFSPDLDTVARHSGLSPETVVELHSKAEYRVHCLGFTPGFPYLGGLPAQLATPRHAVPRKEVPAGAVAIGGTQSGIYPVNSPGGWNVIGRTWLRLFDPQQDPPALLRPGDRVHFRAATRDEFEATRRP